MIADFVIIDVAALLTNFISGFFNWDIPLNKMVVELSLCPIICFFCLLSLGAYNILWRYFKLRNYLITGGALALGILLSRILLIAFSMRVSHQWVGLHGLIALIGLVLFRAVFKKSFLVISHDGEAPDLRKRTLIVGGGSACSILLKEIATAQSSNNTSKASHYLPVCIVDDNEHLMGMKTCGVPILGKTGDIERLVRSERIESIIFAIPSCPEASRKRIIDICTATKLPLLMIPPVGDAMLNDNSLLEGMHSIRVEELLGRNPVSFNKDAVKQYISGKVCMVTGGGGSIGSELVRQIAAYSPRLLVILDIYENNAYDIQQELTMEYGNQLNLVTVIASVRDFPRMNQIFQQYKPEIIFHAAAHKHVPLMEFSPVEAVKNNVIGTYNVASLAVSYGAEKFVMVSTDKAVNPTNIMGASKRCCEMIVQYFSQKEDNRTCFVTTRFGNVLGSNGSVIPLFRRQIEQGKPVTVTDPEALRYFMSIPEACSLLSEAAAIAKGGEIFVLNMGQPVKILTLAENLIRMYGKEPYTDVKIVFTGLRPGEKLREELLMSDEGLQSTENSRIFVGNQLSLDPELFSEQLSRLTEAALENDSERTVLLLKEIVPTYTSPEVYNKCH